jgi:membrane-associated phospholipid phosphatase
MRKLFSILFCSLLLNVGTMEAQPITVDRWTPPASNVTVRTIADAASWATVGLSVALDTKASWDAPDTTRAFLMQGGRLGVTYLAVFAVKKLVERRRPCSYGTMNCGIDNPAFSFYSAHAAVAAVSGNPWLAGMTAAGRVIAGKHYLTDVLVGLGAGWVTRRVIR